MTDEGSFGSATSSSAGATLVITVTEACNAGDACFVWVAWDNNNAATPTGPSDVMLRCDDQRDNDWRTLASGQAIGSGASTASHCAIFGAVLDTELGIGDTITITHTGNSGLVAKAATSRRFSSWGKANIGVAANGAAAESGSADPASIALSSMASREYLILHGISYEGPSTDSYTQDSDYTSIDFVGTDTGTDLADQSIKGGFRIATLTGDTVDVAADSRDHKQILVACFPTNAPYVRWSNAGLATTGLAFSVTSATPSVAVGNSTSTGWIRKGDVVVAVESSQQIINMARSPVGNDMRFCGTGRLVVGDITMTVKWRRLLGDETSIVSADIGAANAMSIVILGGCCPTGTPFENLGEATEASTDTSVEFTGNTAGFNEELILLLASHGIDANSTNQYSGYTNANLTQIEEIADNGSNAGNGIGIGMATGILATAGSVGTTTATLGASDVDITVTLGFKPKNAATPTTPWVRTVLDRNEGSGALALSWDASEVEADDVIFLFVNSEAQDVATPTDYNEAPDSPQSTTGTELAVFYKVADGTETGLTIADSGDHQIAAAIAVANADVDSVLDVTAGGVESTSDTSLSATGDTTTVANTLVLIGASHSTDDASRGFYGFNNADLAGFAPGANLIEQVCEFSGTAGAGGGVAVACAPKAAAGAFGATTATLVDASPKAFWSGAVRVLPAAAPSTFVPRVVFL